MTSRTRNTVLAAIIVAALGLLLAIAAVARAQSADSNYGVVIANPGVLPVTTLTTGTYSLTAADCGGAFNNTGAGANATFNLLLTAPIGCTATFVANNGGFDLIVKLPTGNQLYTGGSPTSAAGTATYAAAVGAAMTVMKFTSTKWVRIAASGSDPSLL